MSRKDPELEALFSRITALEAEYQRAKSETDSCRSSMNSEWNVLHSLQQRYQEYKNRADEEFQSASYCWQTGDRASAKVHSENGKMLNAQKSYIGSDLDSAHRRYDPAKAAFERAKAYQNDVFNKLKEANAAKNRRLDELKAAKAAEEAHWREKSCKKCGSTIRYRDDWSNVPNYCKECKAKFEKEKKAREQLKREKPCRGCGATIVYYTDWKHIPNYCEECRKKGNSWSSNTDKELPKKKMTYGILDYSHGIKKQNIKDLSEGEFGTHTWYDPYSGKMGEVGPNYPGSKRKPMYDSGSGTTNGS